MKIIARTKIETKRTCTLNLSEKALCDLLRAQGIDIPHDAEVSVYVPGGGDWSHTDLDICEDTPVKITWVERTTEER